MNEIPEFEEALQRFRHFLTEQGHSADVFWVFREELWQSSVSKALIKYPPHSENESLTRKVFAEGRARGLVEITALVAAGDKVAATIWFPKFPHEQVQGWNQGMKLSISKPLQRAKMAGPVRWKLLQFLPRFQEFQKAAITIGTRAWAAA